MINKKQNLIIIGSTGSVGVNALEVVKLYQEHFCLIAFFSHSNYSLLANQINMFAPQYAVLIQENLLDNLCNNVTSKTKLFAGTENAIKIINDAPKDTTILIASSGTESLLYLEAAMANNLRILISNKESIVCGGDFLKDKIINYTNKIIPVDSEHSAIFQALEQHNAHQIDKILLTASGGPFLHYSLKDLEKVTVADALNHPIWSMGAKITIDSATLMNKALEIIEASYLFNIPYDKIKVLIHPQALLHGGVFYKDGSFIGHFANPSMQVPLAYALFYPYRKANNTKYMDTEDFTKMQFFIPDEERFKALKMAKQVLKQSNNYPCAFNASNEIAVLSYISNKISFVKIMDVVEYTLNKVNSKKLTSIDEIIAEYSFSKQIALNYINNII